MVLFCFLKKHYLSELAYKFIGTFEEVHDEMTISTG